MGHRNLGFAPDTMNVIVDFHREEIHDINKKKKKRKKFLASVLKVHCQLLVIMSPVCDLLWETI